MLEQAGDARGQRRWLAFSEFEKPKRSFDFSKRPGPVARDFKKVAKESGLVASNGGEFGLHSMKRGAVTEAVNAGADEHSVMKQMRVACGSTVSTTLLKKAAMAAL